MKKILSIIFLFISIQVLSQNVLTFTGPYSPPDNFYYGNVTFQYILVNGEKVKHGSYRFVAENFTETGSYIKGKKNGLWTQKANSYTIGGDYTKPSRLNTRFITYEHNYVELVRVKTVNYSNGLADGAYNEVFTYTQKWWYPKMNTSVIIKKRNGVYAKGKRVSKYGAVYKNGVKNFFFNVNYKNDEIHGKTVFQNEEVRIECEVKNGQLISQKETEPSKGKVIDYNSYKPDSVIFKKFHDPKTVKLYGNGRLYVDTIPNTKILRYNIINVDTSYGNSVTSSFADYLTKNYYEDSIGSAYIVEYVLDQYPIHKIDLEKKGFVNLDDEFKIFSQYFNAKPDKLSLYHIEKEYYDKGSKIDYERKYGMKFSPELTENNDTMYVKRDTVWHDISDSKYNYFIALGDTSSLLSLKYFPKTNYNLFSHLLWVTLRHKADTASKYYKYIVANNNEGIDNDIINSRKMISYYKTTNCPRFILDTISNSLDKIMERRLAYNKNYLANDSVVITKTQIWSNSSIKKHLENQDVYQNWENDFYYVLFDSIENVCPRDLKIPTIEDIEYNTQSDLPLNELIPFAKETYLTLNEADENQKLGAVLVVKEFNKNKFHFYSVKEKRIVDKEVHSSMVRCVQNKK